MNLFVILKLFHNPSQVPIVILSPGREPVTRSEKTSVTESATELFLYQEDLQNFYKQAIPIVHFYNTRDHYAPSCVMSSNLHNQWKINIVKDIFSHGLELIEEVDTSLLNVPQRNVLLAVQTDVTHLLRVFPNTRPASQAATLASKHSSRDPHGPLIKEPIPYPSTVPNPPSGTSTKKKKRKTYICEMCGVEKSKQ